MYSHVSQRSIEEQLDDIFDACEMNSYEETDSSEDDKDMDYCDDSEIESNYEISPQQKHSKKSKENQDTDLPYKCEYCNRVFKRTNDRQRHTQQFHETEGREEICVICNAHFAKKSQLRIHISSQHGKNPEASGTTPEAIKAILSSRPYKCSYDNCSKMFPTEGKLKKHLKRHQDKRHLCGYDDCDSSFAFRKELQEHIKTKHALKEFICTICDNQFASIDSLRQHLRLHQEKQQVTEQLMRNPEQPPMQKVFRCEYDGCNRVYQHKKNLNQHIKSSHQNRTFDCDLCKAPFKYKINLKRHYKTAHNKVWRESNLGTKEGEIDEEPTMTKKGTKRKTQTESNRERPKRRKENDGAVAYKLLGPRYGSLLTEENA